MKIKVEIEIENSENIFKALKPDIGLKGNIKESLELKNGKIVYEVENEKFNHLKASVNTLLSLIEMLKRVDENVE